MKSQIIMALALSIAAPVRARETAEKTVKPYPFDFCIVQEDEQLDPDAEPYAAVHEGQRYRFCCLDCWEEFRKDPTPSVKKLEALLKRLAKDTAVETDNAHETRHPVE